MVYLEVWKVKDNKRLSVRRQCVFYAVTGTELYIILLSTNTPVLSLMLFRRDVAQRKTSLIHVSL